MSKSAPGPREIALRQMREAKFERVEQAAKAEKPKKTKPKKLARKEKVS